MAGKQISMSKIKQVIRMRVQGVSLQKISQVLRSSRNTVRKYLQIIEVKGYKFEDLLALEDSELEALFSSPSEENVQRYSDLESFFPYMKSELKRVGVTRWLLWGEYKDKYPSGYSYSQYCDYYRQWQEAQGAVMHFEHEPGDKLYIDYAGKKLEIVDRQTGEIVEVEVFVCLLGYSQLTYVEAVYSQKKEDFIASCQNGLRYFGGVPRVLVPDNLRSAVTKASRYEAELNETFLDFANHYQTTVMPTRSYKPRDKSLVENAVNIAYKRIYAPLRNRIFHTIEDLNKEIWKLLEEHNNHPFQKEKNHQIPYTRRKKFEESEKVHLQALPVEKYEIKYYKKVTVMKNCHVYLSEDKHYYSVPYQYIGKKVKLIYTQKQFLVFWNTEQIACHRRNNKKYAYSTIKNHLPSTHQFVASWNPDKFINWAARIDESVKAYIIEIIDSKIYPEQAYRSCVGILSMEKKVGTERLINAVKRAIRFNSYSYKTIENILKNNLDTVPEETTIQTQLPFHENLRGAKAYK